MYSPEIREDLVPLVYRAAKSEQVPMTTWVNRAVERELALRAQPQTEQQQQGKEKASDEQSIGGQMSTKSSKPPRPS